MLDNEPGRKLHATGGGGQRQGKHADPLSQAVEEKRPWEKVGYGGSVNSLGMPLQRGAE